MGVGSVGVLYLIKILLIGDAKLSIAFRIRPTIGNTTESSREDLGILN